MGNGKVRIGLIGLGNMGGAHLGFIAGVERAELAVVCDIDRAKADQAADKTGVAVAYSYKDVLDMDEVDAVLIATPHYDHTPIAIAAFEAGKHVLVEKPVGVHANDVAKMTAAWEKARAANGGLKYGAMFMMRTLGQWKKVKDMVAAGELGKLTRVTWIITDWFRTQHYYDTGGWRATWAGEGGGVLLNQCPHNLDLYQWIVGMPDKVTGFASIGKYHHIEVEDEVTAYFEYAGGTVAHFITTTGESPGTNRLEIVGENGKLICENGQIIFIRNERSMLDFLKESDQSFARVPNERMEISYESHGESGHRHIIENFVNAVLDGEELIAPATDGINSVSLGNAIMLSALSGNKPVPLPIDGDEFERRLKELVSSSKFTKRKPAQSDASDFSSSYSKG